MLTGNPPVPVPVYEELGFIVPFGVVALLLLVPGARALIVFAVGDTCSRPGLGRSFKIDKVQFGRRAGAP